MSLFMRAARSIDRSLTSLFMLVGRSIDRRRVEPECEPARSEPPGAASGVVGREPPGTLREYDPPVSDFKALQLQAGLTKNGLPLATEKMCPRALPGGAVGHELVVYGL